MSAARRASRPQPLGDLATVTAAPPAILTPIAKAPATLTPRLTGRRVNPTTRIGNRDRQLKGVRYHIHTLEDEISVHGSCQCCSRNCPGFLPNVDFGRKAQRVLLAAV